MRLRALTVMGALGCVLAAAPIVPIPPIVPIAAAAPLAVPGPGPWQPDYEARQWRLAEAASKARLHAARQKSIAAMTPNQQLWDAVAYDLRLTLNPTTHILQGDVTCKAVVTTGPLATVELDLSGGLAISSATSGGLPATFTRAGALTTVNLDHAYATGDTLRVRLVYQGDPEGDYFGWGWYVGAPLIWTLSEPHGAREWWPCKDSPADKADQVDLRVTVPDGLIVASNGNLLGETLVSGQRTFHWRESYPIATYLVSLAIHPYVILSGSWEYSPGLTMPIRHYVVPDRVAQAQSGFAVTVPMLQGFSEGFGLYPFVLEKYGHAHFPWPGGMEHQTLTSLYYGAYTSRIIAHELAHQWWGDLVTCADFHHIWLNEGFATWAEAYWRELTEGMSGYQAEMAAAAYLGPGTIYVANEYDIGAVFSSNLSYNKGSWIVHMLRGILGDEDFFAALRAWATQYAHASVRTEDLEALCEQFWGGDMNWFFQPWIHGQYYPVYEHSFYTLSGGDSTIVNLNVWQRQTNTGLFTMPLDVRIVTSAGAFATRVWNDAQAESYRITVAGTVFGVELDPDNWVLCQKYSSLTGAPPAAPAAAVLRPNQPNPFNPSTTIVFELPRQAGVLLTVHDLAGRRLCTLVDGTREAGRHEVVWDGRSASGSVLPSGTYIYQLQAGGERLTRKMSLLK